MTRSLKLTPVRWIRTALIIVILTLASATAWAATPTEVVKQKTEEVTTILAKPESPDRSERLQKVVQEAVDFRELASRALGKHWADRSPEEQQEFLDLLQRMLEANYADQLQGYQLGEDYQIEYGKERVRDDRAVVRTTIKYEEESHPVVYRMTRKDGDWVIYDILIDDISLEETYRDGYVPIIEEEGWGALIERMKERIAELEARSQKSSKK